MDCGWIGKIWKYSFEMWGNCDTSSFKKKCIKMLLWQRKFGNVENLLGGNLEAA